MTRQVLRATVFALLVAVLWAAVHPAVINAAEHQSDHGYRVLVCTPQGMAWIEVEEPGIETLLGLAEGGTGPSEEPDVTWQAACPWCQLAQVVPAHHGHLRQVDATHRPYLAYAAPAPYVSPIAESTGHALAPPVRGPPSPVV